MLGKDLAQSGKTHEVLKKATASARKVKANKAKESPKTTTPKAKATNIEVLSEMINYIIGLDFTKLSVMEIDMVAELGFTIESKVEVINEVWEGIKVEN